MYMHHFGGENTWFINMPLWVPEVLAVVIPLMILFVAWSIVWKGLALWHAARRGEYWWFMALLVINTLGLLEIIYLFFIAKLTFKELFSKHDHRA